MSRGGARRHGAPVTSDEQDRGQNKDRHQSLRVGDSKVHNRFLAISRDGRHGDDKMRPATSVNNPLVDRCDSRLKTDATAAYSRVERLKTSMVAGRACQRL